MSFHAEAQGADRLAGTLAAAADDLADLDTADRQAGTLVADVARRTAPRLTGALAGTVEATVTGSLVEVTAGDAGRVDYAVPVHKQNPWMTRTAAATKDDVERIYADATKEIVGHIKGK